MLGNREPNTLGTVTGPGQEHRTDVMEKVWVIEDPDEKPRKKKTRGEESLQDQKSPAASYSLSLLLWGAGQFHADLIVKGLAYLFLMLFLAAAAITGALQHEQVLGLLRSRGIALSDAFLAGEAFLLVVLVFWAYNAAAAYHVTARESSHRFTGVKSRIFPALCSLLFPGWGQYLNGQPVKGGIYASLSVVGIFALFAAILTVLAWPALDASPSRDIIEGIFAAALFVCLTVPFVWTFGCYDALKVSMDDYLKEPFFERVKAMNNRRRTQGWVRGVFPRVKNVFVLALVLAVLAAAAHWAFPEGYYVSLLDSAAQSLRRQGMTIVPEIIGTMLSHLPRS